MSIENLVRERALLVENVGKIGLNIRYPDEFELYVFALELLDEEGNTLKYFIFPVNPKNVNENQPRITSVKKTMSGIHVLRTNTFIPKDISLTGTFGRRFRILLGEDYTDLVQSFQTPKNKIDLDSLGQGIIEIFDERTKTGYGCCKILESIINGSQVLNSGREGVRTLLFHNLALGNSYVVEPMNLKFDMSQESNMIWNYSLSLKAIAPLSSFRTKEEQEIERTRLTVTGYIQTRVDDLIGSITRGLVQGERTLASRLRQ